MALCAKCGNHKNDSDFYYFKGNRKSPCKDCKKTYQSLYYKNNLEKIETALPQVKGLEAADTEMDDLAGLAQASYKDLMDLGMQVDSRFASEIFNSAGTMLGHAITAKTAKINKKLKMIDLQLKKASLDMRASEKTKEIENVPVGEGSLLDRNELLKSIIANNKKDNN